MMTSMEKLGNGFKIQERKLENSEVELTNEELLEKIKVKYQDIQIDFQNNEDIKILEYTESRKSKNCKVRKSRNSRDRS